MWKSKSFLLIDSSILHFGISFGVHAPTPEDPDKIDYSHIDVEMKFKLTPSDCDCVNITQITDEIEVNDLVVWNGDQLKSIVNGFVAKMSLTLGYVPIINNIQLRDQTMRKCNKFKKTIVYSTHPYVSPFMTADCVCGTLRSDGLCVCVSDILRM